MLGLAVAAVAIAAQVLIRELVRRGRGPLASFVAGSLTGYAVISALAFGFLFGFGTPGGPLLVSDIKSGFDAEGKLHAGDELVSADGRAVADSAALSAIVNAAGGAPVAIAFERDGVHQDVTIRPRRDADRWLLGITTERHNVRPALADALGDALAFPARDIGGLFTMLRSPSDADPAGPTRIVQEVDRARQPVRLAYRVALALSVNLLFIMLIVDGARSFAAGRRLRRLRRSGPKS